MQNFLETVTLVSALMLSLTITAGTAVTFEELTATNVRFSRGVEPPQSPSFAAGENIDDSSTSCPIFWLTRGH